MRDLITLLRQTRNLLAFHQSLGLDRYPRSPALDAFLDGGVIPGPPPARQPVGQQLPSRPAAASNATPTPIPIRLPAASPAVPHLSLAEVRQELAVCRQCPLGSEPPLRMVGEGGTESGLLIVADLVPTGDGEPGGLAGPAADLLTRMLAAIGLRRESVYLTALPKCQAAREPLPEELRQCSCLVQREIAAAAPQVICTMGPLATQSLLGTRTPLFKLRGRFHRFLDLPLMPTFHPAYLLRNPEMKKAAWHDLQAIQKELRITS